MKSEKPKRRPAKGQSNVPQVPESSTGGKELVPQVQSGGQEHSTISPSKLKDLEICPSKIEDNNREPHPVTLQGTKCHKGLEDGSWKTFEDPEELAMCKMADDYVQSVIEIYRKFNHKEPAVFRETKLTVPFGIWGFADVIILEPDLSRADLIDYKFSTQLQEDAETNPQGQAYAIGVFHRFPKCQQVTVTFLYPRLTKLSIATFRRSDLLGLELRFTVVVERIKKGGIFHPHPDVCMYCVRKGSCEALLKTLLPVAQRYAKSHDLVLPAVPDFSAVKDPHKWSILLAYAPVMEDASKSIRKHASDFVQETGAEIPGFTLATRNGRQEIVAPALAWDILKQAGMSQQTFLQTVEVSATKVINAVGDMAPRGEKAKAKQDMENRLRDAGVLTIGEPVHFMQRVKDQ